jgi:cytochrome c2
MPSSLRLLATFVIASILVAIGSVIVLKEQDHAQAKVVAEQLTGGSVDAGKRAFTRAGCGACHAVSLMPGADGQVGPPLDSIATRVELAGHLANSPENMRRWIQHPQQVDPGNGMPDMGTDDRSAKDISAYLYTLKQSQ